MPNPFSATTNIHRRLLALLALAVGLAALSGAPGSAQAKVGLRALGAAPEARVDTAAPHQAAAASTQPLTPKQIHTAYALPDTGARGQKIAIVSAFNDPYVQTDLTAYDKQYGLPACTKANRCLRVLNEKGEASPLPVTDPSGGQYITESALGVELVRGVCQSCSIMLVEASSTSNGDIAAAINAAAGAGATVVTTSITPFESSTDASYEGDITHRHTAVVAAAGDAEESQYGYSGRVDFPASLPDVLAVGGTQLTLGSGGRYGSEQAWVGTVTGCSIYNKAPSWQIKDAKKVGCETNRAVADVSAMADPGAIVHITGTSTPGGPWYAATGTSVSAPIIAGVIGLAGSAGSNEARMLYRRAQSDPGAFHDITTGANSPDCNSSICEAVPGYDGPTGLGTPDGLAAFLPSGGALTASHPGITLSAPGGQLRVSGAWVTHLGARNDNAFAVSGTAVLRRTLLVSGQQRSVVFASAKLKLGPLASDSQKLTIAAGQRGLLRQLGSVSVYAEVRVRGPAGRSVTVTKTVALRAP